MQHISSLYLGSLNFLMYILSLTGDWQYAEKELFMLKIESVIIGHESQVALNILLHYGPCCEKSQAANRVFCILDTPHLKHFGMACCWYFAQDLFYIVNINQSAISAVLLDLHTFALGHIHLFTIFPHGMQKFAGSISFLLSGKYQTCLFIWPSAFESLCLAQRL